MLEKYFLQRFFTTFMPFKKIRVKRMSLSLISLRHVNEFLITVSWVFHVALFPFLKRKKKFKYFKEKLPWKLIVPRIPFFYFFSGKFSDFVCMKLVTHFQKKWSFIFTKYLYTHSTKCEEGNKEYLSLLWFMSSNKVNDRGHRLLQFA